MDLLIPIDRTTGAPLRDQLYAGLRAAILDGRLAIGDRLPASRAFAKSLGISRFTVDDAYSRLIADGYVIGKHGSGTFVAYASKEAKQAETVNGRPAEASDVTQRRLSDWALRLPTPVRARTSNYRFSFKQGVPALDPFPLALWRRCRNAIGQEMSRELFGYGSARGYEPLRVEIAGYLARSRMVRCDPDQIVITAGTQQALDLICRLVLNPGDSVVVEEPSYLTARRAFLAAGATLVAVPVDGDGLQSELLAHVAPAAKLAYVTPSHQFPTGGVLPLARRRALLEWARQTGAAIVEDDYDSEFRYGHRPIEALAALEDSLPGPRSVLYVGTFSKVLYPSIRLGYIVAPPDLAEMVVAAKEIADRHPSTIEQATLAAFIAEGHFERHLARMRRVYALRQQAMIQALDVHFGQRAIRDSAFTAAGLHVMVDFDVQYDEAEMLRRADAAGVLIDPISPYYISPPNRIGALLGYAVMDEAGIDAGIAALATALLS